MDWMKLKSGTDVRGTALGDAPLLTAHVAQCLGMAFARYVAQKAGKPTTQITIALGRDSRLSGPAAAARHRRGHFTGGCVRAGFRHVYHPGHVYEHFDPWFPA